MGDEDGDGGGGTQLVVRNMDESDEEEKENNKLKKEGLRPTFYDRFGAPDDSKPSVMAVFKKHNIYVSVLFYGMLGFLSSGYQSVFVVWVQSDTNEYGLDWSERSIGTVSAIVGPIYVIFQLL